MIVFYTKFNVIESFDISCLFTLAFECVKGMKNVPESFKTISWNGEESGEWKVDNNLLAFEIDPETEQVAFSVAIVDDNGELWTTDISLNNLQHEIQLRLSREKKIISAEYDRNFNLPYIFKKIVRDGLGGMDDDLPVIDKPIYIDNQKLELALDLISGSKRYSMPIIYVSHPFNDDEYKLDVNELAKDMAGSAHVLVEESSVIALALRELTQGKNPYNGAIEIYYDDYSLRYFRRSDITANQFRYRISHAVYARMSMRNIDNDCSLSALRIRNKIRELQDTDIRTQILALEIEDLKEKRKSDADVIEMASEEIKDHEKRINE